VDPTTDTTETMTSLERRLARLESVVESQQEEIDEQQAQIEAHRKTIAAQQETIDTMASTDTPSLPISRRRALQAGGALGLLGLGAGTASANSSGQIGNEDRPVDTLYTQKIDGGITNGIEIDQLVGSGLGFEETENASAVRVDWEFANDLEANGELTVEAKSKWESPTENNNNNRLIPQVDAVGIEVMTVFSGTVESETIRSTNAGSDTLSFGFGDDSFEMKGIEEDVSLAQGPEKYLRVNDGNGDLYISLYEEDGDT